MYKLYIATSSFGADKKILKKLESKFLITKNNTGKKLPKKHLISVIKNKDYIIAGTEKYDEDVLMHAKNLKVIFRFGSGVDNIDLKSCKKKNILIKTTKVNLSSSVAELAITLILNSLKNIESFNYNLKRKVWKKKTNNLIFGKTLGIIGFGKIGKKLVNITKGFGLKYLYYDIKKKKTKIKYSSLKNVFKNSDIISIHQSFLKNHKNYIDNKFFKIAKKNLVIINTSRGDVINENHLFHFLKTNKDAYAGIDVFNKEPYYGKLRNLSNIILTPHIGSYSKETRIEMEQSIYRQILTNLGSFSKNN